MRRTVPIVMLAFAAMVMLSCSHEDSIPGGSGLIEATEVVVSAETSGRLEVRYVDEGDTIAAGDPLGVIDSTTVLLYLAESQAALQGTYAQRENARLAITQTSYDDSLATKDFNRISRLLKAGSANQQQYDQAENAARKASSAQQIAAVKLKTADADIARIEAEIDILEKQLGDCTPSAPVSGTVVTTFVEVGELVATGKALVKIARLDTVTVKIYLPPGDLAGVKLGNNAQVDPEIEGKTALDGVVTWISPEAEFTPKNVQTKDARADLVYAVKVTVPNPDQILKIGMPVYVRIPR